MAPPAPIAHFYLRPLCRSRLSVEVEVYRTVGEFRAAVRAEDRAEGTRGRTRGLVGQCARLSAWRHPKHRPPVSGRKTGLFARLRFPQRHLRMSTITHECFHATLRWAQRVGIPTLPTDPVGPTNRQNFHIGQASAEERCATFHDALCTRLVWELQRRHLIPR